MTSKLHSNQSGMRRIEKTCPRCFRDDFTRVNSKNWWWCDNCELHLPEPYVTKRREC